MTVEVGDHADGVREAGAVLERRTPLVVHQDEGHGVRAVRDGQRGDEGLEELGFPGAGGARDQGVWPVPTQIERPRAVDRDPDRCGGGAPARPPAGADVVAARWVQAEQVEQSCRRRKLRLAVLDADVPQRGERTRHLLAPARRDDISADADLGHATAPTNGQLGVPVTGHHG